MLQAMTEERNNDPETLTNNRKLEIENIEEKYPESMKWLEVENIDG